MTMFVDTNVLVAARAANAPGHRLALDRLAEVRRREPLRISRQVVREYLAVVTRNQTWAKPLPMSDALLDATRFASYFEILDGGAAVLALLVALCREVPVAGKQVHDANIVATMLAHGEKRLLTFNTGDFRRFGERIQLETPGADGRRDET